MCSICEFRLALRVQGDDGAVAPIDPVAGRQRMVALLAGILAPMGLQVAAGLGDVLILSAPTGAVRSVPEADGIWSAVEALSGRRFDPLHPCILEMA